LGQKIGTAFGRWAKAVPSFPICYSDKRSIDPHWLDSDGRAHNYPLNHARGMPAGADYPDPAKKNILEEFV
jgi:hypothetical protein